ncbi:MAG: hypothetical protein CMJ49_06145 [Planctomycetaceae bacterium]|nr:hypothetical protein [Planctomycetaceae bacterium]
MSMAHRITHLFIAAALFSFILTGCDSSPPDSPGEAAKRFLQAASDGAWYVGMGPGMMPNMPTMPTMPTIP